MAQATPGDGEIVYDTIELADMEFQDSTFYYPCPCGDLFELTLADLLNGWRIATCPSCSLRIGVCVTDEQFEAVCLSNNVPFETIKLTKSGTQVKTFVSLF